MLSRVYKLIVYILLIICQHNVRYFNHGLCFSLSMSLSLNYLNYDEFTLNNTCYDIIVIVSNGKAWAQVIENSNAFLI